MAGKAATDRHADIVFVLLHARPWACSQPYLALVFSYMYLNFQDTRVTLPPGAEAAADNQGCFFYLAGVNDYESDPQYEAALNGREESVATVLLAHEPVQVR